MSELYPLLLRLNDRKCVVVGGGVVALRKAEGLLKASANVVVISPSFVEPFRVLAAAERLTLTERPFVNEDLDGAALAFAATNRPDVNRQVAEAAAARGISVNWADDGARGDFITPASVRRGDLIFAVSASGAGPALAARIIREIGESYGDEYEVYVEILKKLRETVRAKEPDAAARARLLRAAASERAMEELLRPEWTASGDESAIASLRRLADEEDGKDG